MPYRHSKWISCTQGLTIMPEGLIVAIYYIVLKRRVSSETEHFDLHRFLTSLLLRRVAALLRAIDCSIRQRNF